VILERNLRIVGGKREKNEPFQGHENRDNISEVKVVIKVIPDLKGYSILRKLFHGMIELP